MPALILTQPHPVVMLPTDELGLAHLPARLCRVICHCSFVIIPPLFLSEAMPEAGKRSPAKRGEGIKPGRGPKSKYKIKNTKYKKRLPED